MAVSDNRVTFWFGCNMLRHAEMIRLSIMLLERASSYDVRAAGGPAYCCGTAHDHQPHAASNMAGRTVGRFNEAVAQDGRGTVVTWCPSCHMHMSDIMAPGNTVAFDIAHISELLAASIDRLAPLLTHAGAAPRAAAPASRFLNPRADQRSHFQHLVANTGARTDRRTGSPWPHVQRHCRRAERAEGGDEQRPGRRRSANRADTVCTIFHPCHLANSRRSTVAITSGSGTGSSSLPKRWGSRPATPMSAGATRAAPDIAAIERAEPSSLSRR